MNEIRRLTSEGACGLVASMLGVPENVFWGYFQECGRHPRPSLEQDPTNWSMPEVEAIMLYAIVRAAQPATVLELGTHLGYSTRAIMRGLVRNDYGLVVTLDREQHLQADSVLHTSSRVVAFSIDGIEHLKKMNYPLGMVFEDGDHTEENTYQFLSTCLPRLNPKGVVVVHDVAYEGLSEQVRKGMERSLGANFESIVIDDSPCGLGIWVKS